MEITVEELQKKFASLPEDLRWAIMAANVDDNIIDIGQMHNLTVKQMGQLSLETQMVMYGFIPPDGFESSLKMSMGLPEDKIKVLVGAVNEKILKGIREKLMTLYKRGTEISKEEDMVLKSAGLNINEPSPTQDRSAVGNEGREEMLRDIENPSLIKKDTAMPLNMAEQKMTGTYQKASTKTEYSLQNLSRGQNTSGRTEDAVIPKVRLSKEDPYRMSPEE